MIVHMDVSHNEISDHGGVALAKALGMRSHLTEIYPTEIFAMTVYLSVTLSVHSHDSETKLTWPNFTKFLGMLIKVI